jgi:hypothetical protein
MKSFDIPLNNLFQPKPLVAAKRCKISSILFLANGSWESRIKLAMTVAKELGEEEFIEWAIRWLG